MFYGGRDNDASLGHDSAPAAWARWVSFAPGAVCPQVRTRIQRGKNCSPELSLVSVNQEQQMYLNPPLPLSHQATLGDRKLPKSETDDVSKVR